MSQKKLILVVLALALVSALGCSRNKQQVPASSAYTTQAPQPVVNTAEPAARRSSSTYIK